MTAIFGAGRSGIAAAEAILASGGAPIVFEEAHEDNRNVADAACDLRAKNVEVITGWTGEFADTGCDLVVTSPGVDMRHPKLQNAAKAGLEVISEIELAYRISRAPIVAITGTNGKSTTTVMTWLCLRGAGVDAVLCGNVYGSGYDEVPLTEAAAKSRPGQILVAEVSSFQLEWVRDFKPVAATITNVSPDHMNRYANFAEYVATKRRVFAAQGSADTAVARIGDPAVLPPPGPRLRTIGPGGDAFEVDAGFEVVGVPVEFARRGHDRLNAMAAVLLAQGATRSRGVPITDLARGLAGFKGLTHRMEWIGERAGIVVINNSMCTNPKAVESSSRSLQGRRHVLMGGINKMLGFEELAVFMEDAGDEAYLYGRDGAQIAEQLAALSGDRKHVVADIREAFECATHRAKAGETIILSPGCASFDQFEDFRQRGDEFRRIAQEWLAA